MTRSFWIGFVVAFVVLAILDTIVNTVLLGGAFAETTSLWRPEAEIKLGLIAVCWVFIAFFFTLIFAKWYRRTGIGEGALFGLYVTGLMVIPAAYMTYATMPIPYSLAFQWWVYGGITYVIIGIILSLIFGRTPPAPAA